MELEVVIKGLEGCEVPVDVRVLGGCWVFVSRNRMKGWKWVRGA